MTLTHVTPYCTGEDTKAQRGQHFIQDQPASKPSQNWNTNWSGFRVHAIESCSTRNTVLLQTRKKRISSAVFLLSFLFFYVRDHLILNIETIQVQMYINALPSLQTKINSATVTHCHRLAPIWKETDMPKKYYFSI